MRNVYLTKCLNTKNTEQYFNPSYPPTDNNIISS